MTTADFAVFGAAGVLALSAGLHAQTTDRDAATPIEQALIERACSPAAGTLETDRHDECLHARLVSLRADFGRDLSRLSGAERRKIDSACEPIRASQGREGYLDCLGGQLVRVQNPTGRARAATSETAAVAVSRLDATAPAMVPPAPDLAAGGSRRLPVTLVAILATAVVVPWLIRARRPRRVCRACGARVATPRDLCQTCRQNTAEALRRAARECAKQQCAQEELERRQLERDDADRQRRAREGEDERLRQVELARERDEAARKHADERRRQEETAERPCRGDAADAEMVFDPYAILGVQASTNLDAIRAAYELAKTKYDCERVAGFGFEVKQHYMAKAQVVDRAFQMLSDWHGRNECTSTVVSPDAPVAQVD